MPCELDAKSQPFCTTKQSKSVITNIFLEKALNGRGYRRGLKKWPTLNLLFVMYFFVVHEKFMMTGMVKVIEVATLFWCANVWRWCLIIYFCQLCFVISE